MFDQEIFWSDSKSISWKLGSRSLQKGIKRVWRDSWVRPEIKEQILSKVVTV